MSIIRCIISGTCIGRDSKWNSDFSNDCNFSCNGIETNGMACTWIRCITNYYDCYWYIPI